MLKWLFLTTAIIECVVGTFALFFAPIFPYLGFEGWSLLLLRMYGAAALSIGLLAYLARRRNDQSNNFISLQVLAIFQLGISTAFIMSFAMGEIDYPYPAILHSVFFVWTLYCLQQLHHGE